MTVTVERFADFFRELWGHGPYPWQCRLAQRVCDGDWPRFIDLPTASGKTACLDVAVFALAVQAASNPAERSVGRRIFFVVNRRVIVDEAHERACCIASKLYEPTPGTILHSVAEALRHVSGNDDSPPLDVAMLCGGIVRDNRWARSITQPTIITSTIDQVGSRLLFRGYGVSPEAAPLHAALVAHDSTILLDEAHISQPFVETLEAVQGYRGKEWSEQPIRTPFHFVQMTATPGNVPRADVFRLGDEDRKLLHDRHGRPKWISLCIAEKAKGKDQKAIRELAAALGSRALELQDDQHVNVAVVVNRIATARQVYRLLRERFYSTDADGEPSAHVELAIGRMRPLDRDDLTQRIQNRVGKSRKESPTDSRPMFVVATQCLEVGADFDFDTMVSECASIDALRQRFGRLNRAGRNIDAHGCIVIRADQVKSEEQLNALDATKELSDPIYCNALARTWNWLQYVAADGKVDFGVNAMNAKVAELDASQFDEMLAPRLNAPIMFPAYMDMWVQTSPVPVPSPDVALFLHGPQRGEPDVNVCWREDLPDVASEDQREDLWRQIVSICPPSSPECMPVPIGVVRKWLTERDLPVDLDNERSDLLDEQKPDADDDRDGSVRRPALAWRGVENSRPIHGARDVKPGDTIVLPVAAEGWDTFGHIPDRSPKDLAERAYRQSRGQAILRLYPSRIDAWFVTGAVDELKEWINDEEGKLRVAEIRDLLRRAAHELPDDHEDARHLRLLAEYPFKYERYPNQVGVVLQGRRRIPTEELLPILPTMDDGEDEPSRVLRKQPVSLDEHLKHVRTEVDQTLNCLSAAANADAIGIAAELHDIGKADKRFQAYLMNGDLNQAWEQTSLWAKHPDAPASYAQHLRAMETSGRPNGFRHEMLSVQLAEILTDRLPEDPDERDLVLHLIAAHHGRARPFAPVVIDDEPPDVVVDLPNLPVEITAKQRRERPPHRLDSGIGERFWKLTRSFGWWGLAYLEATLRLADQRASEREEIEPKNDQSVELQGAAR